MRWKAKKKPDVGDTRTVRRFIWWPLRLKQLWVWLEFADVDQQVYPDYINPFQHRRWKDIRIYIKNKPKKRGWRWVRSAIRRHR